MTGELMPYGCDLPMWHEWYDLGVEEVHRWHVIGLYGIASLRAVRVAAGETVLPLAPRDSDGAHWLGSDVTFHGAAPELGGDYFHDCKVRRGPCWGLDGSTLHAMGLIERLLPFRNRDVEIHRALIAEYHMYVAHSLTAVIDPVGLLAS